MPRTYTMDLGYQCFEKFDCLEKPTKTLWDATDYLKREKKRHPVDPTHAILFVDWTRKE